MDALGSLLYVRIYTLTLLQESKQKRVLNLPSLYEVLKSVSALHKLNLRSF